MLECHNLNITRGNKHIIKNLSFNAKQGEFIVLLGENGAGKSTLLSAICDDLSFTGQVTFYNQLLSDFDPNTLAKHFEAQGSCVVGNFETGRIHRIEIFLVQYSVFPANVSMS